LNIEKKLRESLLPVFGLDSIEKVQPVASLVLDLGADSLDFVEITYIIERDFGIVLKANELIFGGRKVNTDNLFSEGKLTAGGLSLLRTHFPSDTGRFMDGMTKMDLFQSITVRDLANIIQEKLKEKE
jgi:acyl carrier protein